MNNNISSNNNSPTHRTLRNFNDLSVVDEEEEIKKDVEKKEDKPSKEFLPPTQQQHSQQPPPMQQTHFPFHPNTSFDQSSTLATTSFDYQPDCPFVFPGSEAEAGGYSNNAPMDGNSCLLMTTHPPLYTSQQSSLDTHNHCHPPPPAGWQSNVSRGPASNFPPALQSPEVVENGQVVIAAAAASRPSLAERRKAFFRQHQSASADNFRSGPRDNGTAGDKALAGNCSDYYATERKKTHSIDDVDGSRETIRETESNGTMPDASLAAADNRPRHFFAPLPAKSRYNNNGDGLGMDDSSIATRLSDNSGNSSNSEKTVSTVVSRSRYNCEKGGADICVNGAIPCANGVAQIERGDAKAFFSSENLLVVADVRNNGPSSNDSSGNPLTKSVSCQDLSSRLSFTETFKFSNNEQNHARSDNTLDNISVTSKAFKSQLNVTLRQPGSRKSMSPDTPEIPKLPSIDYKLFNNPFLQNFEQAYQNFPVRTEGPSPVTHPLSIQVSESPVLGTSYSSPVRVQPSFTGPSTAADPDCGTCKRKDLDRLRLMIPPSKLLDPNGERQEYHVTSFETPSPHTLQIPPMTPYELEALRRMPTGTSPVQQNSRLYQNVPFVPRGAAVYCPGQGMRMYYDTVAMKVPAQTQTSLEEEPTNTTFESDTKVPVVTNVTDVSQESTSEQPKKRRSRKEKSGSVREKRRSPSVQRRKDQLKKQTSVSSKNDVPSESPSKLSTKARRASDAPVDDKRESRSSSSGQESPKKADQTKRVSLYFSARKRPSVSSVRTSRSRSVENARERRLSRADAGNEGTNSERERTNSTSSREAAVREKTRKGSTSSGSVPWCACWGNGCI